MKRSIANLVIPLCAIAGFASGFSVSGSAMQGSLHPQIRQPDHWIPMTIDYTIGNEDGVTYLREYRRSVRETTLVVLGEPDVAFEPPARAKVQRSSEPRGGPITELPSSKAGRASNGLS